MLQSKTLTECAHVRAHTHTKFDVMFSSKNEIWETPLDLFNTLNEEFHFTLDPCALPSNAKCANFFTPDDDGLRQNWDGNSVFCNPPYGRVLKQWVKKAFQESRKHNTIVVMLIPARTDTTWFHEFIYHKAEIRFLKGRLHFSGHHNAAPFPSMLVIFR